MDHMRFYKVYCEETTQFWNEHALKLSQMHRARPEDERLKCLAESATRNAVYWERELLQCVMMEIEEERLH